MARTTIKTRETSADVDAFIEALPDARQQDDSRALIKLMAGITKAPPKLWGPAIIGFGSAPLKYASGRELDWPVVAFSPRKAALSIYLTCDIARYQPFLAKLGKHKTGKGCLYVKRLSEVDMKVLEEMIKVAVPHP